MQSATAGEREAESGYLVSPLYDCLFFIYSPLLALVLGIGVSHSRWLTLEPIWLHERWAFRANLAIGTLIAAHLGLVLVRSHANGEVFRRHPWRFTLVPLGLFLALYVSIWLAVFVSVLAVWWDLYHSSMQTFGLCRLYERKAGNDVEVGRGLDMGLNLLLYVGPILGGATLANHLKFFDKFERVDSAFFTAIPAQVQSVHRELTWLMLGFGTAFLAYYVYSYWRLAQGGHRVSHQKILLLVSTGFCSITTWGFNSFGQAFFIMNFFHAVQYFAIVWWSEGGNLKRLLRLEGRAWGTPALLVLFLLVPLGYGVLVTIPPLDTNNALFCLAMVITIMHFWYDGFIWSVRQSHV
jgi:hypothetical protein